MQRLTYMEDRERELNVHPAPLSPKYAAEDRDLSSFRAACVDRMWKLAAHSVAFDGTTAMSATRLFDRCMGVMRPPICRANMLLLAVACFDICYKAIEGDIKAPGMRVYYVEGFLSRYLDYSVPFESFPRKLRQVEVSVLKAVKGQPTAPSALDYLLECCPHWAASASDPQETRSRTGRRAAAAASAYSYLLQSAEHTSEEIAAGAAWLALGSGKLVEQRGWPTPELAMLCTSVPEETLEIVAGEMAYALRLLFEQGASTMMYYFYRDVYEEWCSLEQAQAQARRGRGP